MGRQARKLSSSGIYHVMFRGINHQHLFEEDSDYKEFLWKDKGTVGVSS